MSNSLSSHELLSVIAQQAPAAQQSPLGMLLMMGLFFAAMWFLMIAPQRKKQKEHQKMLAALKAGDEVLTAGGIYGTVSSVKDDRVTVRIGDNTKVEIGKSFITAVEKKAAD